MTFPPSILKGQRAILIPGEKGKKKREIKGDTLAKNRPLHSLFCRMERKGERKKVSPSIIKSLLKKGGRRGKKERSL